MESKGSDRFMKSTELPLILRSLFLVDTQKRGAPASSWLQTASWDPAADSESHTKVVSRSPLIFYHMKIYPKLFFQNVVFLKGCNSREKTAGRNIARNDIKYIREMWLNKETNGITEILIIHSLLALQKIVSFSENI